MEDLIIEIEHKDMVVKRVTDEFDLFYAKEMNKTKGQIFDDFYEIHFYNEMKDFLTSECVSCYLDEDEFECLYKDGDEVLANLYSYYLKQEYASINNWDDIRGLVKGYNARYHSDIMGGTEIE